MDAAASADYLCQPGYRGNLTTSQTTALLSLWRRFLRLCHTANPSATRPPPHTNHNTPYSPSSSSSSASASGDRLQHYNHNNNDTKPYTAPAPAHDDAGYAHVTTRADDPLPPQDDRLKDHLRSIEESKDMHSFLAAHGGAALKREFWAAVKGEHPDAVMLRFLRARKWDVDRALALIGSVCAFRVQHNVSQLVKDGELGLCRTRGGWNILNNGISFILGATRAGEPLYVIEVGAHYSSNQSVTELQQGVIYLQELLGLFMPPPVEKKVVIFNLTNFGIRNMDWSIVLFMAKTMESFYPETLARVYVHGAPWIFKPIWSILRPLLDPVVRDKVHLTWKVEELDEHVPADRLPRSTMNGDLDFEFAFPPPVDGENDIQLDTAKHDELRLAYLDVITEFENATRALARSYGASASSSSAAAAASAGASGANEPGAAKSIGSRRGAKLAATVAGKVRSGSSHPVDEGRNDDDDDAGEPEGSASLRAMRDVLATKLRVAWLRLKPYVVGKTKYDRWGVSKPDGTIHWTYTTMSGEVQHQVLGENASLPALERALAEIEGATKAASPSTSPRTNGHKPLPHPAVTVAAAGGVAQQGTSSVGSKTGPHVSSNLATAPVVTRQSDVSSSSSSYRTRSTGLHASGATTQASASAGLAGAGGEVTSSLPVALPATTGAVAGSGVTGNGEGKSKTTTTIPATTTGGGNGIPPPPRPPSALADSSRHSSSAGGAVEEAGQVDARASVDTGLGRYEDVIPIHPSDPAFERARNADGEVKE